MEGCFWSQINIIGVATQGMGLVDEWTTAYRLAYSNKSERGFKEYSDNKKNIKVSFGVLLVEKMFFVV